MSTPTLAPTGGPERNVDDASLMYHINLLFVALLAVAVLVRLPRALALLGSSSDWLNGHILRYTPFTPSSRRFVHAIHGAYPPSETHTPYRYTEKGSPVVMKFPPHIAACAKPLRPLLTPLRARIQPGFTVGQVLILLVYFYALVYAGFYRSNIFTDTARTGWIAISQLPFVFAFAQKNNLLGSLLGYGYEKLNFLHRFAGRLVVLAANIHSFHFFYQWSLAGTFKKSIASPQSMWGLVALICLDMIFLFSIQAVRSKAYNFFLSTHIVGFILVLPAAYLHKPTMLPYVYACLAIYLADILFRCIKSRLTTAFIRPLPELDLTRVEIPSINAGWRAGQHIRLRVFSLSMGWAGWTEIHPFTIASVAQSGEEGMVLMCKRAGGWTNKLYEVAKRGAYTEGGVGREINVVVEGPYGGPGHTIFASFSAAVFVVGGSGITYALSAIQDLVEKDLKGESRVKVIELVWIVTDPACLSPLLPTFADLIRQSVFTPLRVSVFYSRAPTGKQPAFFASAEASPFAAPLIENPVVNEKQERPAAPVRNVSTRTKVRTALQNSGINIDVPPVPNTRSPTSPIGDRAPDYLPRSRPPASRRPSSPYKSPRVAPQPPAPTASAYPGETNEKNDGELQRQGSSSSNNTTTSATHVNQGADLVKSPTGTISRYAPQYAPQYSQSPHFPHGLTLAPGKPRLAKFLEHALQRAVTLSHGRSGRQERAKDEGRPSGMVVGVCGPVGLADDVAAAVGGLDPVRRDQVGGVELCEEVFGW
ncbi:hypothetical protein D9613_010568 [Agrocybe pediades]|uniref:ferric-chelate reductase (NADPH) n=1 Tax=Agrocybe pediades TaxID=84607 RepID=A0A8H4QF55_9AGAR|nr:hypothetical protein D9613_010568 [Agrocybe pediades]